MQIGITAFLAVIIVILVGVIAAVVRKFNKVRHTLHDTQRIVAELQQKQESFEAARRDLSAAVSQRNTELEAQRSKEEELNTRLKEAQSAAAQLQEELSRISAERDSIRSDAEKLQESFQSLNASLDTLRKKEATLQEQLHKEISSRTSTESTLQMTEEQLRAKIDTMELFIDEQKSTIRQLTEQTAAKDRSVQQLQQSIQALTSSSNDQSQELQQTIGSLHQTIQALESTIGEKEKERGELELVHNKELALRLSMEQNSAKLEERIAHQREELEDLHRALESEKSEHAITESALQESKEKLYEVIRTLEHDIAGLKEENAQLKQEGSGKSLEISSLSTKIKELQHSLLALVQESPFPACLINNEGVVTRVNQHLCALHASSEADLQGKNFSLLFPEEEREFFREQWRKEGNSKDQFFGDTTIVTTTSDTVFVHFAVIPLVVFDEMIYIGFFVDKTKEQEAELHARIATEKENELAELKTRFISMVSNQLRASVVTIATNVELLERFIDKWPVERRYLAFVRINESLKNMKDLLRDVVLTTQSNLNTSAPRLASVNLEELCQSVAKEVQQELEAEQRFIFIERGLVTEVQLDSDLITPAVRNALSNAFKYSPHDSDVTLKVERDESRVVISVEDHGRGIPAADQQFLFRSFFRGSNAGNIFGTGLGLTIIQQCIERHGGTVAVDSILNKGTTITMSIPVGS